MTFREIEQFVLESWLVLFVVDNFRLHRFLHKKTQRKSWFFCVSPLPIWIPLKRQSVFTFFGIPGSLLRPPDVRICNETANFLIIFALFKNMHFWMHCHSISFHQEAAKNCLEFKKTWKSIAFLKEFISVTETHKKINFFVVFFCAKRRKLSTTKSTNQLSNTKCSFSRKVILQKHQKLNEIARFWASKCGRD